MSAGNKSISDNFSEFPSVRELLSEVQQTGLAREILVRIIREAIHNEKQSRRKKTAAAFPRAVIKERLLRTVSSVIGRLTTPSLKRVINGTGIVLHTGLGRAPLSAAARERLADVTAHYSCLEVELESGNRGERLTHTDALLRYLTGAESSAVVNNNAAAVFLALNTLASGKEAVIARGQLIEIGGSFRLPEIMAQSGAVMREVGTTNKTYLRDYEKAIRPATGLLMIAHTSNYRVKGFTHETPMEAIAALGRRRRIPVLYDLGGGALVDLRANNLPGEPLVPDAISKGADIVTFSADKILGGPQAGIIIGKKKYIDCIRKNPLMRVLRCDKMILSVLESTLRSYLFPESISQNIPSLKMLGENIAALQTRAEKILTRVKKDNYKILTVMETFAEAGSGTMPLEKIPSLALKIVHKDRTASQLAKCLRGNIIPIFGYIKENTYFIDMRTIRDDEIDWISDALNRCETLTE